jgi:hypothetical protein
LSLTAPTQISPENGITIAYYNTAPTISWSGGEYGSGLGYFYVEKAVGVEPDPEDWEFYTTIKASAFADAQILSLPVGQYVRYRVCIVESSGNASDYITSGNLRRTLPEEAPVITALHAGQQEVLLAWESPIAEAVSFKVQLSVNQGAWEEVSLTQERSLTQDITAYPIGTVLKYRVAAVLPDVNGGGTHSSAFAYSDAVTKSGGLYVMAEGSAHKGGVLLKHRGAWQSAKRTLIKQQGKWRETA